VRKSRRPLCNGARRWRPAGPISAARRCWAARTCEPAHSSRMDGATSACCLSRLSISGDGGAAAAIHAGRALMGDNSETRAARLSQSISGESLLQTASWPAGRARNGQAAAAAADYSSRRNK
jgi:hypothetical protein